MFKELISVGISWKEEFLAVLTSCLIFIYGPPHQCLNIFIGIVLVEFYMSYSVAKKATPPDIPRLVHQIFGKVWRYSALIFIANGFDIFLGKEPTIRNYMLFALFIIETTHIFTLLAALGFTKEIQIIKAIVEVMIKKNPLGEVLKDIDAKEGTNEKK